MWRFALLFSFFFPITILANNYSDVVFNEIAWMGNQESSSKEWLELYNNTGSLITLDNWKIVADDNTPNIILKGEVQAHGFYLLERTSDQTLPGILADQIYTGALENSGENIKLIDQGNNLIDEVRATDGWPGGDNSTKQTMEAQGENRTWQTSQNPGGTPDSENSPFLKTNPSPVLTPSLEIAQKPNYAPGMSNLENKGLEENVVDEDTKEDLAAKVIQNEIGQSKIKELSPLKVLGLALIIAGLSGTAILMLKRLIRE